MSSLIKCVFLFVNAEPYYNLFDIVLGFELTAGTAGWDAMRTIVLFAIAII